MCSQHVPALVYPMYVLQARMAIAEPGNYKGIWDCARQTVRKEGATALFKGYSPSLMRIGPYKVPCPIPLCAFY